MQKNWVVSACFIVFLLFIVYQAGLILSPFASIIFWAALLAFCFYPLYNVLLKRLGGKEGLAALLTTFCALGVILPINLLLVFKLSAEAIDFAERIVRFLGNGGLQHVVREIRAVPLFHSLEAKIHSIGFLEKGIHDWLVQQAKSVARLAVNEVGVITTNIFLYSLAFILAFILLFAFLKYGQRIMRTVYLITPLDEKDKELIFAQVRLAFTAVIRGQLVTGFVQAVLAGAIFYFLGLPSPLFLAAATFIASLVPVLGASAVWVPCAVYLLLTQHMLQGVIMVVMGVFGISLVDNFVKPAIIGGQIKLPYSLLFLAVLGGVKVYGFTGIFIAPIIFSLLFALIRIYRERYVTERYE